MIVLFVGELDREEGGEDSEHKQEVPTASGIQIKLYTVHPKYEANLLLHVHLLSRDHFLKQKKDLIAKLMFWYLTVKISLDNHVDFFISELQFTKWIIS